MPGLSGRRALVKVSGTAVPVVDQATTNLGDNKRYQITTAARRTWDPFVAVVVKIGGTISSPTGADPFTINRLIGTVNFTTANAGRAAVTVSVSYLPLSVAAGARGYSFALAAQNMDDTDFDNAFTANGFVSRLQAQLDFTGTLSRRYRADFTFRDAIIAGNIVVIEIFTDRASTHEVIGWAIIKKSGHAADASAMQDSDIEFEGTADADGRVVSVV